MLGHGYEPVVDFVLLILQYSNFPISSNFLGILKPLSTLLKFSTQLNTTKFHIRHLYHPSLDLIWPLYILTFPDFSWILGIIKPLSTLLKFSTQPNTTKFLIRPLYHPALDFLWPPLYLDFSWLLLTPLDSSWILLTPFDSS